MSEDAFQLVSGVVGRLCDRANEHGIESLTPGERTVLLPEWACGLIENDGFPYFFSGATNTLAVAEAYQALGLGDAAEACRKAHALVPPDVLEGGWEACREWMGTLTEEELRGMFDPLDEIIWASRDRLTTILAEYIHRHGLPERDWRPWSEEPEEIRLST